MTMTDDIRDDLAYVKALAEEGRDTPLVGGIMYVIWGGVIGAAALISYAENIGWINAAFASSYPLWITAIGLGWILSFAVGRGAHRKPGATTLGNKTAASVWCAVGIFITGFWLTLMLVHDNFISVGVPPYFLFGLMFPLAFGLYGVAFFATATAGRAGWLRLVAIVAWVIAAIELALMGSVHHLLVGAIGSFVCVLAPGIILMRGEPAETV